LLKVKVVAAALGSKGGFVDIKSTGESWGGRKQFALTAGTTPILTIPEAVEMAGPNVKLFIAKIDIEGFERDVFAENTEWVTHAPVVIIKPHDYLFASEQRFKAVLRAFAKTEHELLAQWDTLMFII
jgi:FkbM family methyltransferase